MTGRCSRPGGHGAGNSAAVGVEGAGPDPESPQDAGPGVVQSGQQRAAVVGMGDVLHGHPGEVGLCPTEQAAQGGVAPQEPALRREQRQFGDGLLEGRLEDPGRREARLGEVDFWSGKGIVIGHGGIHERIICDPALAPFLSY